MFLFTIINFPQVDAQNSLVKGLVLLNCAGGMNNKAIVDDWRIKLLFPLLLFIDFLLKQKGIASFIFERVRQRFSILFYFNFGEVDMPLPHMLTCCMRIKADVLVK